VLADACYALSRERNMGKEREGRMGRRRTGDMGRQRKSEQGQVAPERRSDRESRHPIEA
jgi:hypothetical protein